jgi:hypothetical protein
MQSGARPTSPEDAPRIAALLAEAGLHPNMGAAEMHWKYWQGRADWPAPRSFVLVRGGKIIAHAAVVPGICASHGARLRTIHLIDWAARADAIGAGVSLMKHIGRSVDALLAVGGSRQTLAIVGQIGFRPIGVATTYVRTLHPLRILRSTTRPRWRTLPRVARSALWTAMAPRAHGRGSQIERVGPEEIASLKGLFPVPSRDLAVLERSEPLLRYLLACPIVPIELYAWKKNEERSGYFLLARAPGQTRLVDCWTRSGDPADWRELILSAVRKARADPAAAELVAWASDSMLSRTLERCGFHARGAAPVQVLAQSGSSFDAPALRVQMADNDAAYFHEGGVQLIA